MGPGARDGITAFRGARVPSKQGNDESGKASLRDEFLQAFPSVTGELLWQCQSMVRKLSLSRRDEGTDRRLAVSNAISASRTRGVEQRRDGPLKPEKQGDLRFLPGPGLALLLTVD